MPAMLTNTQPGVRSGKQETCLGQRYGYRFQANCYLAKQVRFTLILLNAIHSSINLYDIT